MSSTADARLDKVETEVRAIADDVSSLKGDMRAFGGILGRIESSITAAQQQMHDREHASRPNMIAVLGVLITLISIIVGGAWLISGQLASTSQRLADQDQLMDRTISMRDRELDRMDRRLERLEFRSGGSRGISTEANQ